MKNTKIGTMVTAKRDYYDGDCPRPDWVREEVGYVAGAMTYSHGGALHYLIRFMGRADNGVYEIHASLFDKYFRNFSKHH